MQPRFVYFDMGNVLLPFSHEKMAEQMARVAGIDAKRAWQILFEDGLEWAFERGELTSEQFYGRFCEAAGSWPDMAALNKAANEIFEGNAPIMGLVGRLFAAGYRLGVCSNTSPPHWDYCTRRFGYLTTMFAVHALSFRLKAIKPDPAFYVGATRLAGVEPAKILFADDRADNVAAAKAAGWDAMQYESVSQLNQDLRSRGVVLNY
jgi:HAD superfamily hydrolase (TIGR01509 family)